jgi:ubiquinone/menaquinone biosynthesis C-methylase UbiE
LSDFEFPLSVAARDPLPSTIADKTRWVYDRVALFYPLSTFFFHSKAHARALEFSGIRDGMRVLEVATGSGEMFRRIVNRNPSGHTVGFDLSPNMAAYTLRRIRRRWPDVSADCKAVDARFMPFRNHSFDAVVCCYLLELLAEEDILRTIHEIRRVLVDNGKLTLVLIGQNTEFFNHLYRRVGSLVPAFWGRQVDARMTSVIQSNGFRITREQVVRQTFYPSRVLVAQRTG